MRCVVALAWCSVLILVACVERAAHGRRADDVEDAAWMLGHLLLVPTVFALLGGPWGSGGWWSVPVFVLVFESGFYVVHRACHRFSAGWAIHRLHHSASVMGTLLVWRAHVGERVAFGACAWVAAWVSGVTAVGVLGWMVVATIVQVAAHWREPSGGWLDRLGFVSSRTHRAHHWVGARWNYGHTVMWFDDLCKTALRPNDWQSEAVRIGDGDISKQDRHLLRAGEVPDGLLDPIYEPPAEAGFVNNTRCAGGGTAKAKAKSASGVTEGHEHCLRSVPERVSS